MGIHQQYPQAPGSIKVEWLVFFVNTPIKLWWNKIGLTRPGFEHCLAVSYSPHHHRWLMLDWNLCGLDHLVLDQFDLHQLFTWAESLDGTVVNYQAPAIDIKRRTMRILPISCVTIVQHALKIDSKMIHTPYQLYKYLMQHGARTVRGEEHGLHET